MRRLILAVLLFVAACSTVDTDTNGAGGNAATDYTSVSACVDDCQGSDHPNCVSICNSSASCAVSNPGSR